MKSFLHSINLQYFKVKYDLNLESTFLLYDYRHLTDTVLKSSQEEISVTSVNQENLEKAC